MAAIGSCCCSLSIPCKPAKKTFSVSSSSSSSSSSSLRNVRGGGLSLRPRALFETLVFSSNLSLSSSAFSIGMGALPSASEKRCEAAPATKKADSAAKRARQSEIKTQMKKESNGEVGKGKRRIWRRRKLAKTDDKLRYKMDRIPFLEEQVRRIRENGKIMAMDIERLLLSEENRFDFVNEVAAEAKEYVENNRDEYGAKKPILHVLSNRMNEAGFQRPEAYMEPDPFKPGRTYLRHELYDA